MDRWHERNEVAAPSSNIAFLCHRVIKKREIPAALAGSAAYGVIALWEYV
jgi:hypothetical protein